MIIIFTRPVDRNYIMENAPTLFSIKDAQNNPIQIDTANIVIEGNRVELPIKRDSRQLQENEQIQVVVAPEIKDDKGAAVSNPGAKVAVAATQAPVVASNTKSGQVVAVVTTPVPPTSTTAVATTSAPQATAPVVQPNGNPTSITAPPGSSAAPATVPVTTATATATASTTAHDDKPNRHDRTGDEHGCNLADNPGHDHGCDFAFTNGPGFGYGGCYPVGAAF